MSLHIRMTEEAELQIKSRQRNHIGLALLTAIMCTSLLVVSLYIAVIVIPTIEEPEVTAYAAEPDDMPLSDRPVTPERTRSRPSASTPTQASIITTSAVTDVPVVTVDIDMPDADIAQSMGPDIGTNWGDDGGIEGAGFGGTSASGSALEGTLYDFKQTRAGSPTDITPQQAAELMKEFVNERWNANLFNKYFKAPVKLYASHIYISNRLATEAPKAFKCEDKVQDSRWCAVYRGNIMAPKSGKFRFVGAGDDGLVVRFNHDNVFDFGWYQVSAARETVAGKTGDWYLTMIGKGDNKAIKKELLDCGINIPPVHFHEYSTTTYINNAVGGLACGKTFEVKAGEIYPVEILVTEIPGGAFGAYLLIEEVGAVTAKKDAQTGAPILPLFRTNYALPDPKEMRGRADVLVPFDPVGIVWQVAK